MKYISLCNNSRMRESLLSSLTSALRQHGEFRAECPAAVCRGIRVRRSSFHSLFTFIDSKKILLLPSTLLRIFAL